MTLGFIHQKRIRKLPQYDTEKDRKTTISFSILPKIGGHLKLRRQSL